MVRHNLGSRKMLLEAGGFKTNLPRRKIYGNPPARGFVVGALLNSTLNAVNRKWTHCGGTPCPVDVDTKGCYPKEPKSRWRDAVVERPALRHPFQDVVEVELQFTGTILSFCQTQCVHVVVVP